MDIDFIRCVIFWSFWRYSWHFERFTSVFSSFNGVKNYECCNIVLATALRKNSDTYMKYLLFEIRTLTTTTLFHNRRFSKKCAWIFELWLLFILTLLWFWITTIDFTVLGIATFKWILVGGSSVPRALKHFYRPLSEYVFARYSNIIGKLWRQRCQTLLHEVGEINFKNPFLRDSLWMGSESTEEFLVIAFSIFWE